MNEDRALNEVERSESGILDQMEALPPDTKEYAELKQDLLNHETVIMNRKNYNLEVEKAETASRQKDEETAATLKDIKAKRLESWLKIGASVVAALTTAYGIRKITSTEEESAVTSKALGFIPKLKI